jgi:hypothetical protein
MEVAMMRRSLRVVPTLVLASALGCTPKLVPLGEPEPRQMCYPPQPKERDPGDACGSILDPTPYDLALGDFNGDAVPELVATSYAGGTVTVLLGRGDGLLAGGPRLISVAVADFDGDGRADLITLSSQDLFGSLNELTGGHRVARVLFGGGDGTFRQGPELTVDGPPGGLLAVGELDGDGKPDLIVTNPKGEEVDSLNVFVGNGDGKPDVVTANSFADPGTVSVLLGNGDGTFRERTEYYGGFYTTAVVAEDLDGDGRPDLATVNSEDNTASVYLGRGDGGFQSRISTCVSPYPTELAVGRRPERRREASPMAAAASACSSAQAGAPSSSRPTSRPVSA